MGVADLERSPSLWRSSRIRGLVGTVQGTCHLGSVGLRIVTGGGVAIVWWALVAACTGADANGPASSSVTAAQACADNAQERCARLESCSPTDMLLRYGSESTCKTRETDDCTTSLALPLNGNTPAAVEACAAAYATWGCTDYIENVNVPRACEQQLGPIIDGGSCAVSGQCVSGFCAVAPGASCGTCAAPPRVSASCAELLTCGPGLTCAPDTATCATFGVRGSVCGNGAVCGVGQSCVGADPATKTQGLCKDAGESVSAPCDPTLQAGTGCDRNAGLVCNSRTKTCQQVLITQSGQPCGNDVDGQPIDCEAEGACIGATATAAETCRAAAADGMACDTVSGPACVTPARCVGDGGTAGTCQYSGSQSCHG
jgi:hypothetical protein